MYRWVLLKNFTVTTENYENFMPHFAQHYMASTLANCFLCHCTFTNYCSAINICVVYYVIYVNHYQVT